MNITEAIPVLASTETFMDGDGIGRWDYRYTDAVLHRQGRGFCGFSRIEATDAYDMMQIREYAPCMYGMMTSERTPGHEIYCEYEDLTGSDRIMRVNQTSRTDRDLLRGFSSITSCSSHDAHGFPLLDETAYSDGSTVRNEYDEYGRIVGRECEELTVSYEYDAYGQLVTVSADNGTGTACSYDKHGRVRELLEEGPDSVWLRRSYVYRSGNVSAVSYTSDKGRIVTETLTYSNGHLREVILDNKTVIYRLNGENSFGQPTVVLTGPVTRRYVHTGYAFPFKRMAETEAGTIQDQGYLFDPKTGNMLSRTDNTRNLKETFTYDIQDRLTGYGGTTVSYDNNGNILNKGDAGRFSYGISGKPYAVSGLTPATGVSVPSDTQEVSYTSLSRPSSITEGDVTAEFDYNADGDRVRMTVTKDGMRSLTRHYIGDRYERERKGLYLYERLYLGGDAYSAPAVIERTVLEAMFDTIKLEPIGPLEPVKPAGGETSETNTTSAPWQEAASIEGTRVYYLLRDCLGSVTHIVSSEGKVVQELSYNAWGRLRNPDTHATYSYGQQHTPKFGRGYTGHEHLPWFGLINMNARLYDPLTGRFLSPDPNVQTPFWFQNLNRYTYAMNNPLCYIDEDGEFFWFVVGAAALIGGVANVATHWDEITSAGGWNSFWKGAAYFGIGAGAGGLGAAAGIGASAWIGSMLGVAATTSSGTALGLLPGAFIGATNGFAEGFLLHTSNSLMHGESVGNALRLGLIGGGIDAAFGCITGGVTGGVQANNRGLNVLDGSEKKIYTGYFGRDDDEIIRYVGITGRDPDIRFAEHLNSKTERSLLHYDPETTFKTKLQARIWEQKQINKMGMKKFGGQLLNKRNEIAPSKWWLYGIKP
ncbi:MAG: RHS repeat-associated core domain-containing protein [Muribaculum sp.]|nr:RHS repeat-associated core domain-containing protein [Muribaculum sp.]